MLGDNIPATKTDTVIKYLAEAIDDLHGGEVRDGYDQITAFQEALAEWLSQHLQYPEDWQQKNIEGLVLVSLKIDIDGSISNVMVVYSPHPSLSKEAVRVVKSMPQFDSTKQKGRFTGLSIIHPIMFRLNS